MNAQRDMRVFLGWDEPVVDKVCDYLLKDLDLSEPVDLEGSLIVVPTRQAGRRLREALARRCTANKTALLSAQVVTPHYFFSEDSSSKEAAGSVLTKAVWVRVLTQADLSDLASLFPAAIQERDFQWALNTSVILENLRQELADGAYTISSVLEQYEEKLEEVERWQALVKLEQLYLAELKKSNKADSCLSKIKMAQSPKLGREIKRIIVAAIPDPSLLAIDALKHIAEKHLVDILVHAPKEMKDDFNEWGRPKPKIWCTAGVEIPDWTNNVFLESAPADQSRRVLQEISECAGKFESGEIAIGVPDTTVIPFLEKDLRAVDLPAFDPSDAIVGNHPIGRLAASMCSLLQARAYQSIADLLRHPDFIIYLEKKHDLKSLKFLEQLDKFQNYYLPISFEAMLKSFDGNPRGTQEKRDDFTDLGKVLAVVKSVMALFDNKNFENAWREFFKEIYRSRTLSPSAARDVEFENAAKAVDSVLREFRELTGENAGLDVVKLSLILVNRFAEKTYHRERRDEVLDLEGWLELPWNDRPFLLVTGMNEDFVPGGSLSDTFLPDSLRNILDLRDDAARFARDVFLMNGIIKSRPGKNHRACFIVGKTAASGDPYKPSRLLFRCDDNLLPERVKKLLARTEDARSRPYADVVFRLKPARAERKNDIGTNKYMSVTSFKDYLECPFRFYLKHVAGMEELNDEKTGLDNMDFGTIIHEALKTMGRNKALWACPDPGELGEQLKKIVTDHVTARFGKFLPLSVEISLMSAIERLRALARTQVELAAEGWEIVEAETGEGKKGKEKERWQFKTQDFTVSGRIDRIDKNSLDGRIRIMDYKTSNNPLSPQSSHLAGRRDDTPEYNNLIITKQLKKGPKEEHKRWTDLQLPLYAMIYAQGTELPHNVELAYFNLPKAVSRTGISVWPDFNEDTMKSAVTCLDGALKAITDGVFWPPASRTKYDDPFASLFLYEPERVFDLAEFETKASI